MNILTFLVFLGSLPLPVLLSLTGCSFILLLVIVLLIALVPKAGERFMAIVDGLLYPNHSKRTALGSYGSQKQGKKKRGKRG